MEKTPSLESLQRYETPTITQLRYSPETDTLLVAEASMFGFDWTGTVRSYPAAELAVQSMTPLPAAEYTKRAWNTIEYEHGVCTVEYFPFSPAVSAPYTLCRGTLWQDAWMAPCTPSS